MKKVLIVFVMAAVLLSCMSTSLLAAPGGFVSSPSGNKAPVVSGGTMSDGCNATIVVTAYGDRSDLSEAARLAVEAAYTSVMSAPDVSKLSEGLAELAETYQIAASDLAISDLFDVGASECDKDHTAHGQFELTIKADTLENYICLMRYTDGEWTIVEDVTLSEETGELTFKESNLAPYAIVVSTGAAPQYPTGNVVGIVLGVVGGVVGAGLLTFLIIFLVRKKKKKDDEVV